MYSKVQFFIDGAWRDSVSGRTIPVLDPATEEVIGRVAESLEALKRSKVV